MKAISVGRFLETIENPSLPVTVNENASLQEVTDVMVRRCEQRSVFVTDDEGRLVGVIAMGELSRHLIHEGVSPHGGFSPSSAILHYLTAENAGDIMNRNVVACTPDESLEEAVNKMVGKRIYKSLPVVDGEKRIVGLLGILSVLEFRLD